MRRGAIAASVVRWSFALFPLALARDRDLRARVEAQTGLPYREHIARLGRRVRFIEERFQELAGLI